MSVSGASAREVERGAGRKGALFRRQPCDHRRDFVRTARSSKRNLREYEIAGLSRHVAQHVRLDGGRCYAIHSNFGVRKFFAQRFGQRDYAGLRDFLAELESRVDAIKARFRRDLKLWVWIAGLYGASMGLGLSWLLR